MEFKDEDWHTYGFFKPVMITAWDAPQVDQPVPGVLADRFEQLGEACEFVDDAGIVLGRFEPLPNRDAYRDFDVPHSAETSLEKIRRAGGRRLSDIIADLEAHEQHAP